MRVERLAIGGDAAAAAAQARAMAPGGASVADAVTALVAAVRDEATPRCASWSPGMTAATAARCA